MAESLFAEGCLDMSQQARTQGLLQLQTRPSAPKQDKGNPPGMLCLGWSAPEKNLCKFMPRGGHLIGASETEAIMAAGLSLVFLLSLGG